MQKAIESDPDLAIGTAKELIETCLKTITNTTDNKSTIPELSKLTLKELCLLPDSIQIDAKGSDKIKVILSNPSSIVVNLNELRGLYGTGHGPHAKKTSLEPRHARLAVGAASTFVNFIFETHQRKYKKK